MPLRADSKFFIFEVFLPEDERLFSDDKTGVLLCPLEIFWSGPNCDASMVRRREGSESLTVIAASRLLETAARLEDPLERKKLEPDNCTSQVKSKPETLVRKGIRNHTPSYT